MAGLGPAIHVVGGQFMDCRHVKLAVEPADGRSRGPGDDDKIPESPAFPYVRGITSPAAPHGRGMTSNAIEMRRWVELKGTVSWKK